VETDDVELFDYEKYAINNSKKVIQIGQQLRKVSSIYLLDLPNFDKMWLTGTKNFLHCFDLLKKELNYLNINKNKFKQSVRAYYTKTFDEYDCLLTNNVVFVDLFDAAANNTVLECIVRNTPIIVNKLPGVVEYLGDDYPLYFNNLDEVANLLTNEKILEAHLYLKNINKDDLSMDYFAKQLINITYRHHKI
jgi:hypothetical protein